MKSKEGTGSSIPDFRTLLGGALAISAALLIIVVLTIVFINDVIVIFDPAQRELYLAREMALQPLKMADAYMSMVLGMVVKAAGAGVVIYLMVRLAMVLVSGLSLRAQQVAPRWGLFPLLYKNDGVYDPNRDNAGVTPMVTSQALTVQERAALSAKNIHLSLKGGDGETMMLDVPRSWPARVPLSGLLSEPVSIHNLVMGVTIDENNQSRIITGNMESLVHIAVGGSSGWGKSVFLRSLGYQVAKAVEKPSLCLCDLEGVTLNPLANSGRLLYPLADSEDAAISLFQALVEEMQRRKALFNKFPGVDSLSRYNAQAEEPLRYIVTLVDEATALLSNKSVENELKMLTLRARKYGLWMVLAGQDWKASSLDSAIRNQLSTRVQMKALNSAQSRVLIGVTGAEEIQAVGRALVVLPGHDLVELQTPWISAEMLNSLEAGEPECELPDARAETNRVDVDGILKLKEEGESDTGIARKIFGYGNNFYIQKVREILRQQQ